MQRGKKILVLCHCVLNANAKIYPLAGVPGVFNHFLHDFIADGFGLFQLPCPEVSYLGMTRWGMTREQYDHPNFRSHCRSLLRHPVAQIEAFSKAGYDISGVAGMDGSPNCGVHFTCEGFTGGEVSHPGLIASQVSQLVRVAGQGVFMSILLDMLRAIDIQPKLMAVQEPDLPREFVH